MIMQPAPGLGERRGDGEWTAGLSLRLSPGCDLSSSDRSSLPGVTMLLLLSLAQLSAIKVPSERALCVG